MTLIYVADFTQTHKIWRVTFVINIYNHGHHFVDLVKVIMQLLRDLCNTAAPLKHNINTNKVKNHRRTAKRALRDAAADCHKTRWGTDVTLQISTATTNYTYMCVCVCILYMYNNIENFKIYK